MMRSFSLAVLISCSSAFFVAPALADEREEAAADMLACMELARDKSRLKCFEKASASLRDAFPGAQALVAARAEAAREAAQAEARQEFGLPTNDDRSDEPEFAEDFGAARIEKAEIVERDEDGDIESMTAGVVEVGKNLRGKIIVVLENGQVWTQINADRSRPYIPHDIDGVTATIKKAAFGSFYVRLSSSRDAFKARRVK